MNTTPPHLSGALRWATLLIAAVLGGCASVDLSRPDAQSPQLNPSLTISSSSSNSPAARYLRGDAPEKAAPAALNEGKDVAGVPQDPLRPDTAVDLDDSLANQDLWARLTRRFSLPELDSPLVGQHVRWYASRPDYVRRMTDRASLYLFHVVDEIERRDMPAEIALLPFIESAFNPQANSSARASGIWQFMPATGKYFDLQQNLFRDDRRDVLASTRAALDYLQRLHGMFGDWHLALAAYNWGEGNLQRAIKRNLQAGLPTDYLSLRMPVETQHYLPKLYAVRQLVQQPAAHGLTLTPIENHPYFVSVPIRRDMDVPLAARLAGLALDEFRALNPAMNKPVILAAGIPQILLPYENASQFVHNVSQHKGQLATWTAWVAPRTMRASEAAEAVDMSEAELRDVNRIPPRMLIKKGSTLLVARALAGSHDVSESVADNAMMHLAPDVPAKRRLSLKAGKNESVRTLARRYGASTHDVARWNKVGTKTKFKKGQAVVVYVTDKRGKSPGDARVASKSTKGKAKAGKSKARGNKVASAKSGKKASAKSSAGKSMKTASKTRPKTKTKAKSSKVRVASAK